jgi:LysM repeat protein
LGLNVLISAVTILIVLAIWGRGGGGAARAEPTATLDTLARLETAMPPPTSTLPPTPTPVTYRVKRGDSFYSIARLLGIDVDDLMEANPLVDPAALQPGDILIVPLREGQALPAALVSSTQIPSAEAPHVEIPGVNGMGDLSREAVRLLNSGGVAHMAGWTLDDGEGHVYTFPEFTLHSGAVSIHTKAGTDTVIDLYWGLDEAIWVPGKVVTLRDAQGELHATYEIPGD